jgi:hypothetical protein
MRHDRVPVLLALDQVNALVNPTGYYDAYSRLLWPDAFAVQRDFLDYVSGQRRMVRCLRVRARARKRLGTGRGDRGRALCRSVAVVVAMGGWLMARACGRQTRGMVLGATSWQDTRMPRHLWQRGVARGVASVVRVPPYNHDEMASLLKLIEARRAISRTCAPPCVLPLAPSR